MAKDTLIADRYRMDAHLGVGGMGAVFRVFDTVTENPVALKQLTLPEGEHRHAQLTLLFEREFHVLSEIAHPRVIEVFDYGIGEDGPFYTMELLDGHDLGALAPLPWRRVCALLRDVASSLALLHCRRIVHRDVGPRNVRCTADGRAKLIDFGAMVNFGRPEQVIGTPPCMAPEAVHGQDVDDRTDLYALGAVAYYALTGRHAFPARTMALLPNLWRTLLASPSSVDSSIPEALDTLVLSLLAFDPAARPSSAAEVIDRLNGIADLEVEANEQIAQAYLTTPALVGRGEVCRSFRKRLLRTRLQHGGRPVGSSLLVDGLPGWGRTRVLSAFALEGKLAGGVVVQAAGHDLDAPHFTTAAVAIASLLRGASESVRKLAIPFSPHLANLCPEALADRGVQVTPASYPDSGQRLSALQDATVGFVQAVARDGLTVLLIDDLHLCDAASLSAFAQLSEESTGPGQLIFVGSLVHGSERERPQLGAFVQAGARTALSGLNREEVGSLVASIFAGAEYLDPATRWIHRVSKGSPSVCMDLCQHLVDRELARFSGGQWVLPRRLEGLALPEDLESAFLVRLRALSNVARTTLNLLSLAHEVMPLTQADCTHILGDDGFSSSDVRGAFDALLANHFVEIADAALHLSFEARATVLQALSEDEVVAIHSKLADHRMGQGDAFVVERHLLGAGRMEELSARFEPLDSRGTGIEDEGYQSRTCKAGAELTVALMKYAEEVEAPALFRFHIRMALVSLAHNVDLSLLSYAKAQTVQLKHDTGLIYWDDFPEVPDPLERIGKCLQRAQQVFDEGDPSVRVLEPIPALRELGSLAGALTGSYAQSWNLAGLASLPGMVEPFRSLGPGMEVVCDVVQITTQELLEGRSVSGQRTTLIAKLSHPIPGISEPLRQSAYLINIYFVAYDEAVMGDSGALVHAEELLAQSHYAAMGWQVRLVFYLFQGDFEQAQECRRKRDLLSLEHIEAHQFLEFGAIYENSAYAMSGDLMALKGQLDRFDAHARRLPGWRPCALGVWGMYHMVREDYVEARVALEKGLELAPPGKHSYAVTLIPLYIECLIALGEPELALARAEHARPFIEGKAWQFEALFRRSHALALAACGDLTAARARLDGALEFVEETDQTGLSVTRLHEAGAQISLLNNDIPEFERQMRLVAPVYRRGRHPGLLARYERLLAQAKLAQYTPAKDLALDEASVNDATVGEQIRTLLGQCKGPQDRALRCLNLVLEKVDSESGYLLALGTDGHAEVLCHRSATSPTAAMKQFASEFLSEIRLAMEDAEDEDIATQTVGMMGDEVEDWSHRRFTGREGVFRPIALWGQRGSDSVPIAVVLTPVEDEQLVTNEVPIPFSTLVALGEALQASGDLLVA